MKFPCPIIDDDIIIKEFTFDVNSSEEDKFRKNISSLLLSISYTLIELRHFSTAIECLNECITLNDDNICDCYFRRSQCRVYNKNSREEDFTQALYDIRKALKINPQNILYIQHLDILMKTIKKREENELYKINRIILKFLHSS